MQIPAQTLSSARAQLDTITERFNSLENYLASQYGKNSRVAWQCAQVMAALQALKRDIQQPDVQGDDASGAEAMDRLKA
jgi:hypothetical protein